jgi:hypothetical protein
VRRELCDSLGCVRGDAGAVVFNNAPYAGVAGAAAAAATQLCDILSDMSSSGKPLRNLIKRLAVHGAGVFLALGAPVADFRSPGLIGPADLFSAVIALRATLLPDGDAGTDADHWLALHAHVFGAAYDVSFELVCPPPRDAGADQLQLRSLLPPAGNYLSPVFVVCVGGNRFAVVSVSAPVQVPFMTAPSSSTTSVTTSTTSLSLGQWQPSASATSASATTATPAALALATDPLFGHFVHTELVERRGHTAEVVPVAPLLDLPATDEARWKESATEAEIKATKEDARRVGYNVKIDSSKKNQHKTLICANKGCSWRVYYSVNRVGTQLLLGDGDVCVYQLVRRLSTFTHNCKAETASVPMKLKQNSLLSAAQRALTAGVSVAGKTPKEFAQLVQEGSLSTGAQLTGTLAPSSVHALHAHAQAMECGTLTQQIQRVPALLAHFQQTFPGTVTAIEYETAADDASKVCIRRMVVVMPFAAKLAINGPHISSLDLAVMRAGAGESKAGGLIMVNTAVVGAPVRVRNGETELDLDGSANCSYQTLAVGWTNGNEDAASMQFVMDALVKAGCFQAKSADELRTAGYETETAAWVDRYRTFNIIADGGAAIETAVDTLKVTLSAQGVILTSTVSATFGI